MNCTILNCRGELRSDLLGGLLCGLCGARHRLDGTLWVRRKTKDYQPIMSMPSPGKSWANLPQQRRGK
jgi:hypothetical protein